MCVSTGSKANAAFEASFSDAGQLVSLVAREDARRTNWIIDPDYLDKAGYDEVDKFFGEFTLAVGGRLVTSQEVRRDVDASAPFVERVTYELPEARVQVRYDLSADPHALDFSVEVENTTGEPQVLDQ